jgi:SAM-dependent methyltransferase
MKEELNFNDFVSYYPYVPTALAIKECVRLAAMRGLESPGPILDVGCGDGVFARLAFRGAEVWGIDIDANETRRAQSSQVYSQIVLGDVTTAKLPDNFFGSCVANCSLEHVPDLGAAARTIYAALKPGGVFYSFLPARDWADYLITPRALEKAGLQPLGKSLTEGINSVFRHHHLEDADGWRRWFADAGFVVDDVRPIGSTASTVAFETFLIPSMVGWVMKKLTGRWTLVPGLRKLGALPVYSAVKTLLVANQDQDLTAEYLLVAHKPSAP